MAVEVRGKMTDLMKKCVSEEERGEGETFVYHLLTQCVCVCVCVQILFDGKCLCLHLVSSSFFSFKMLQDTHSKHL